jgi:hypothetical protein
VQPKTAVANGPQDKNNPLKDPTKKPNTGNTIPKRGKD